MTISNGLNSISLNFQMMENKGYKVYTDFRFAEQLSTQILKNIKNLK